jgi:hypothetical protein
MQTYSVSKIYLGHSSNQFLAIEIYEMLYTVEYQKT